MKLGAQTRVEEIECELSLPRLKLRPQPRTSTTAQNGTREKVLSHDLGRYDCLCLLFKFRGRS